MPRRVSNFASKRFGTARVRAGGFTLLELLVVIVIVAVLAALVIPGYSSVIARARGSKCLSNLKQLYMASVNFASDNSGMSLPAQTQTGSTIVFWHWRLRPYLGAANEYDSRFDDRVRCPAYAPSTRPNYWAWGFGINSKPGFEGAGTAAPLDRFNWLQVNVSPPANWQGPFQLAAITNKSRRLFLCDAIEWQGAPSPTAAGVATFPDYNRHGKERCNVLFYDGHAEPSVKTSVNKALFDPSSL